jgi:hypothetical protein
VTGSTIGRVRARVLAPLAVVVVALVGAALRGAEAAPWQLEAWDLASQGRFLDLLDRANLASERPEAVEAGRAYLLGLALVRVHRLDEARPYVNSAHARGYTAPRGWESVFSLRLRIARYQILRPPLRSTYPRGAATPAIRLYAHPGAWGDEVAADLGAMVSAARAAFPDRLPTTDVYLIPERKAYERFHASLFGTDASHSWQPGTGRVHAVAFCAEDAAGLAHVGVARARMPADLLHEYAHALCEARYGDLYLERVPHWLNEGLADAITRVRDERLHADSPEIVSKAYAERPAPTYPVMCCRLYEAETYERYAVARLMTARLLAGEGLSAVAPLLDTARRTQDFEKAVAAVGGTTGPDLLYGVLRAPTVAAPPPAPPR